MDQVTVTVNVPREVHVIFDSTSANFSRDQEINMMFLLSVQNHMNQLLQIRGQVFVNEVLDQLGLPRTRDGQLLGWANGGFVDFGIFDGASLPKPGVPVGLAFNIDGVVIDSLV